MNGSNLKTGFCPVYYFVFSTMNHKESFCSQSVAARGENYWEGCEISSLVEHIGLSPWLFL